MNFLHDKHSRYYCIFIVTLVLLLFLMGIAVIDTQTAATKEMFLTHNNAIATSLLEEGISKEVIATALMNTEAGTTGNKFLAEIGLSNSTDIENLPYVSAVKNTILTSLFVMLFLWTLLLFLGTMLFLYRRERLYRESENIIKDYIDGNYTVHLPQSNEGTIYQLLSSVDQLATMLQAKNDTEQKTKEFLKNTISDISHQLKTPLSALMMYQEIIENEPENFETVKEFSLKIGTALKRMEQLIQLKDASQMIADNELDFHVSYENKDEMGTLCKEFEMMRSALADNNRKMWRMIDDEKALRNAIAHDIRSPLSILRGYQEMLLEFVSAESIKTEDVIDILQTGMYQIDRIEHFTENMRKMSHLEQRELQCSEIELSELAKKIEAEAAMLSKKESKLCKVERVQEQNIVKVDEELVMEVTDNLLENAVRYAQKSIALQIKKKDGFLIISVEDDGIGFVDTEEKVTEPFYHKNPQDDLKHFGLGMYISRIFCEKHGGNLKIYNARQGGAHVEALFKAE